MRWVKQTVGYWCDDTVTGKYCGKNICTAVLDTGISVHPDLRDRIVGFRDFINDSSGCYVDSGHGTHVAGILAGNGLASAGSYAGMAPDAELLIGKVLDRDGNGDVDHILRGMEWVMSEKARFRIRIVNISVVTQPELADGQKARLLKAVEDLWDAGLTVVVSAGNYGPEPGSVAVPGTSRKVITAGVPDRPGSSGCSRKIYSGIGLLPHPAQPLGPRIRGGEARPEIRRRQRHGVGGDEACAHGIPCQPAAADARCACLHRHPQARHGVGVGLPVGHTRSERGGERHGQHGGRGGKP